MNQGLQGYVPFLSQWSPPGGERLNLRSGRRRGQLLVGALSLSLLAAACGARVSPQLRKEAAAAELQVGGSSGGAAGTGGSPSSGTAVLSSGASAGSTASPAPTGSVGSNSTAPVEGTPAGSSDASLPGRPAGRPAPTGSHPPSTSGSGSGSSAVGSAAPASGNGGATAVGVTATSIQVANVSDLSGPVPGLFQGAVVGTRAYFNYVNSQGGVFGRQLQLQPIDSQTDCDATENAYNSEIGKVFAFVGGFALYDNCAAQVLSQHPTVPSVQYMLSAQAVALSNNFSVDPIPPGKYPNGYFQYYATKFGSAVQKVGTVYPNIPSAVAQEEGFQNAGESVGWKFIYTDAASATQTNFETDVVRMETEGVKIVYLAATNAQNAATLIQEIEQQNWKPIIIAPVAYASNFVQLVGGAQAANGIYGAQLFSLFFNSSDAADIPEVALFQKWMQQTDPSQAMDLYGMYGWAEAALFVQALKAAGPKLTQASVMAALQKIHSFNDNGMIGTANPGGKVPTTCYVLWEIQNGQFVRQDTPPGGYNCNGALVG